MDNPELIELLETELNIIIQKAHNSGLNYWQILWAMLNRSVEVMIQSKAEHLLKGGK